MESTSPKYQLNWADMYKAVRGLLVILAGAALTHFVDTIPHVDFAIYTLVVVSVSSTLIELARRYLINYVYLTLNKHLCLCQFYWIAIIALSMVVRLPSN
jgi:hypothetical protein